MGFQKSVTDLKRAIPGDSYGSVFYPTVGRVVSDLVTVGKFCWIDSTHPTGDYVSITKGTNVLLAGLVFRSMNTVWNEADYNLGYSMNIGKGYECEVANQGSYYVNLFASLNAGAAVNLGESVYVENATGNVVVGVTIQSGYTKTDFKVAVSGVVGDLIVISTVLAVNA